MNASVARFNLITAQAPSSDRRSLSQAWYSALHLAGCELRTRPPRGRPLCHPEPLGYAPNGATLGINVVEGQRNGGKVAVVSRLRASRTPYARDAMLERRARTLPLAKAIVEKVRGDRSATRFVIESPRGRVIIHVVRRDDRVHLTAICGVAVQDEVEKALAQARFALAGMGVKVL